MPRARRIYLEDSIYFVTLEGPYGEQIFKEGSDYLKYLQLLNDCKTRSGFNLYAYALLPDRLHLLIQSRESFPVSHIMQQTTPLYTKYFNQRHDRKGPLFQKRYRSVLVEKENYLGDVIQFIHALPTRHKLAASDEQYPYTSYRTYLKNQEIAQLVPSPQIASGTSCPRNDILWSDCGAKEKSSLRGTCEARPEAISDEIKPPIHLEQEVDEVLNYSALKTTAPDYEFLDKKLMHGNILGSDEFEAEVKKRLLEPAAHEPVKVVPSAQDMFKRMWIWSGIMTFALACITFSFYVYFAKPFNPVSAHEAFNIDGVQLKGPMDEIKRILSELSNLDGTTWDVELIQVSSNGEETRIQDQIRFTGRNFESHYFSQQGFSQSDYTVAVDRRRGVIIWESTQKNDKGEILTWRGGWQGSKMEGVLSYRPAGQNPQDFSFMSSQFGVQK